MVRVGPAKLKGTLAAFQMDEKIWHVVMEAGGPFEADLSIFITHGDNQTVHLEEISETGEKLKDLGSRQISETLKIPDVNRRTLCRIRW